MKKFILIASMVTIAAGFTACTQTPVDTTTAADTTIEASVDDSEASKEDADTTDKEESKDSAEASDVDIAKVLIPENAENVVEDSKGATYTAADSQEDVVKFYEKALKELNAKQTEVVDAAEVSIESIEGVEGVPQAWIYVGTYGADNNPINISVVEVSGMVQVALQY